MVEFTRCVRREMVTLNSYMDPLVNTEGLPGKGIPIGNVTSQIFTNIYLGELDHFVKHELGVRWYGRFSDDFVLLSSNRSDLFVWRKRIAEFLRMRLLLSLHPHKVFIRPLSQGIDFLGYVLLPHHRVLRTSTKMRMFRRLTHYADELGSGDNQSELLSQALASYRGMIRHADAYELERILLNSLNLFH